jgi:putative flavoprotein involved in K+ transport
VVKDVVVIGGGQAGLAAGFYLARAGADFEILDASEGPGGAWPHTWPSLRLFSPADYSSLPGRRMHRTDGGNPDADHVVEYLRGYEEYYGLPVRRGTGVTRVDRGDTEGFVVHAADGRRWRARVVISATGTWSRPFVPRYPGVGEFRGEQIHSAGYRGPEPFDGRRVVVVVGGANSGAQIAADLAAVLDPGRGELTWCTTGPPRYLPDDVDGRELFRVASASVRSGAGRGVAALGDIVVVPPVRAARDAGLLVATPMFDRFHPDGVEWEDGRREPVDAVIWCTGFRPALGHLRGLGVPRVGGRVVTDGPAIPGAPGLFLLGYGDWCGAASATLIGVGQWAKAAVNAAVGR